jgi:hypothetical protein
MGYVPRFTNDIFISYRHTSNASDDKWVDVFCESLQESLADLVGNVTMWRDSAAIRAGDQWRPEIAAALDTTAIFLAIVSRTYFDSSVCRTELDRFLSLVKDPNAAIRRPIVPIFKHPPKPDQDLPQELAEFHHHEFFQWDPPGSPRWREFLPGRDEQAARDFSETLSRLAQDLMLQLETLSGLMRKRMLGRVYLAGVGPELHNEREKLRADLLQRGYWVVPQRPYFWNASDFGERMAEDLDSAQFCIHIIGRTHSIEPETHDRAKFQLERAAEAMKLKHKPPPLVWIQPGETTDSAARGVIDFVEQDLANQGIEYSQGSLEDFKTHIYDELARLSTSSSGAHAREIALIIEEGDIGATGTLNDVLVEKLKRDTQRIPCSGSTPKDPLAFRKALERCGQCIIFWGTQPEKCIYDILTLEALARHLGKERLCVYAAPPVTPEKVTFRTGKGQTIQETSPLNETALRDFVSGS